ncbi:hypothetical protein OG361_12215 [Streptomyces sp. NBC_00090]|uniref:hypothetical protein n=1 Tax=Streptomyces sp. NBC_00090 TaxID=2903619 RepID=UPI003251363C
MVSPTGEYAGTGAHRALRVALEPHRLPVGRLVAPTGPSPPPPAKESWASTTHLRISVAELEYARETSAAEPPPKSGLRRVFGRN